MIEISSILCFVSQFFFLPRMRKLIYYQQQEISFLCNENHVEITLCDTNGSSFLILVEAQTLQWQGFWQKSTVGNGYSPSACKGELVRCRSHGPNFRIFWHWLDKENAEKDDKKVGNVSWKEQILLWWPNNDGTTNWNLLLYMYSNRSYQRPVFWIWVSVWSGIYWCLFLTEITNYREMIP